MQATTPSKEAIDVIKEAGGEKLDLCYQCGLCTGSCPWNLVRSYLVRKIMHQAQLGVIDFASEDIWLCTTCRTCVSRCPRGVEIIDVMRAMRRVVAEMGVAKVPQALRVATTSVATLRNPYGEPAERRASWSENLHIPTYADGIGLLYFSCCVPAYDAKVKKVAKATANVLKKSGTNFGILGSKEGCCGESVRKAGSESLFQSLAQSNIQAFAEAGVNQIVVSSPHCYHSFKNEYPALGAHFEVMHITQYLTKLLSDGKLKFSKEVNKKVAYHDPCYLGRHNGIYDEPREVLKNIPGLEIVEMPDIRENALCCGGGGGRIWMETKKNERFSDLRIQQALDVGANVLAVACPYCMLNFEDTLLTNNKEGVIEVKDVVELVQEAL
jgi:Fe-S oxidoreductase